MSTLQRPEPQSQWQFAQCTDSVDDLDGVHDLDGLDDQTCQLIL